jgi:hypothetical protein
MPTVFMISVLSLSGNLKFGHGLGDVVYLGLLIAFSIGLGIFYFYQKGKRIANTWLLEISGIVFLLFIILKATVFRGPE